VLADARLFRPLFECMMRDDPLIRMRAADGIEKITRLRPEFLQPHTKQLLERVACIHQQEVRWHVAQLVPRLVLNRQDRKIAVALMNEYLSDKSSIVRTNAMQALAELAMQDASLRSGVIRQLEQLTKEGSPAVQSRGRKAESCSRV
jgi:hypothetical protein